MTHLLCCLAPCRGDEVDRLDGQPGVNEGSPRKDGGLPPGNGHRVSEVSKVDLVTMPKAGSSKSTGLSCFKNANESE